MSKTKIEWTNETWNPVTGCTKVSAGCQNCYAERMSKRLRGRCGYPADDPFAVTLHPDRLDQPLRWRKPRMCFVNSMGDLFHEDVPDEFIDGVFQAMALAPRHTFQVLTKRPGRMQKYVSARWDSSHVNPVWHPLPNVWPGTSVEDQATADERIPHLLQCPAAVRIVSCEPLLSHIDLTPWLGGISWYICGGESGHGARPCNVDHIRSIVEQCRDAGVPCFVKQLGSDPVTKNRLESSLSSRSFPGETLRAVETGLYPLYGIYDSKGGNPDEWPAHLRVREFPNA